MTYLLGYSFLLMAMLLDAVNLQLYFSNRKKREDERKPSSIFGAQIALIIMAAVLLGLSKALSPVVSVLIAAVVLFHGINMLLIFKK
ncbi:MAG: hypothetical protein QM758_04455 [Armatimonas sp.]